MFWKYACSKFYIQENTHAGIQFIELTFWHGYSPTNLLYIFRTNFPNGTQMAASAVFSLCQIIPLFVWVKAKFKIHNCCFFAKYVFFVFCLLQFKPSIHYFHQYAVFFYWKYLTAMQWFLVGRMQIIEFVRCDSKFKISDGKRPLDINLWTPPSPPHQA